MATYISLAKITDKDMQAAKQTTERLADWRAKVQSMGVSIKQMYWTLGHYDQVCIFEASDDETAALKFMLVWFSKHRSQANSAVF